MSVISMFPTSVAEVKVICLPPVTDISTLSSAGKVYLKWTDPMDTTIDNKTATWAGTLLVRKAGAMPTNRRDGTIVLDSKTRNAYQNQYFCDSGLSNGVTYYYKFFPYTTENVYSEDSANEVSVVPNLTTVDGATNLSVAAQLNSRVQLNWTEPDAEKMVDGVMLATWASTKVVYKTDSYPTSPEDGTLVLNSTTYNAYTSSPLEVTGLTNGTTYYFALFTVSTDGVANVTDVTKVTAIPNRIKITLMPMQDGTLTYNGNPLSPTWKNYDPSQLTIGGKLSSINAGYFDAEFTPKNDYCWNDNTTDTKNIGWRISKAPGSLSLSTTSVTLNEDSGYVVINVTRAGDGDVTVESSNTKIAKAEVPTDGSIIGIYNDTDTSGTTTITVMVAEGTNHLAPESQTITVNADVTPTIPAKAALNSMSWNEIHRVSEAGLSSSYWAIGDAKQLTINGTVGSTSINMDVWAFIIGFDHNSAKEGTKRIHFQLGKTAQTGGTQICFIDGTYNSYNKNQGSFTMNPGDATSSSNAGGWNNSHMRKTVLGSVNTPTSPGTNTFLAALPNDLRAVMKTCTKYSDNTGGVSNTASNVTATTDYLWLLSEFEILGTRSYANTAEQNYQLQYKYYADGNSKVFYRHNAIGSTAYWWLRSASAGKATSFCFITTSGKKNTGYSGLDIGISPIFCI